MNDREKIIDKVKKLMALSQSPNEHEAALAAEKVQAMLAEYNLSMTDVTTKTQEHDTKFEIDRDLWTDSWPWRRPLAGAVARMYFCTYIYRHIQPPPGVRGTPQTRRDMHMFIGARHNIEVAKAMFDYLYRTVERLAVEESRSVPASERERFQRSFKYGATSRLVTRIRERVEEAKRGGIKTESGTTLPALLSLYENTSRALTEFVGQSFGKLGSGRHSGGPSHSGGMEAGRRAGDRIGLDTQVGGKASRHLLR